MKMRFLIALVWTLLILVLCLSPKSWFPQKKEPRAKVPHADKVVHGLLFAGFGVFWLRASRGDSRYRWVVASGVALAVITEVGQSLPVVGRDCNLLDGVADTVGLLAGVAAYRLVPSAPVVCETPAAGS